MVYHSVREELSKLGVVFMGTDQGLKEYPEIFKEHFVVAPYPEENVTRVVAEVGIEPIVFGSDFPHGEGLAYPAGYVTAQLSNFSDADQKRIMRDNLADFLRLPK